MAEHNEARIVGYLTADPIIKDKTKIKPILLGGGQQRGMRSGTENVPAIAGLGVAVEEIYTDFDAKIGKMRDLKNYFIEGVKKIEKTAIHG